MLTEMLTEIRKCSVFNGFVSLYGGFDSRIPLHEPLRNLRPQRSFCAQNVNSLTHLHQAVAFYTVVLCRSRQRSHAEKSRQMSAI